MNKIILSARDWRIYRALWLLMVMALVVDLCAVLMESDLLTTTAATLTAVETSDWLSFSSEAVCLLSLCGLFWLLRNGREVPIRWVRPRRNPARHTAHPATLRDSRRCA